MKKIIVFVCLVASAKLYADNNNQYKSDTIVITIMNSVQITFPLNDITEIKKIKELNNRFDSLVTDIKLITKYIEEYEQPYLINYNLKNGEKHISSQEIVNKSDVFIIKESDKALIHPPKNQLRYNSNDLNFIVSFYHLNDLIAINEIDIDTKLKNICNEKEIIEGYNRHSRTYHYKFEENNNNFVQTDSYFAKDYDMLELSFSTGANLIRDKIVPDFGFKVGFIFNKKGMLKNDYNIKTNLYYFTEKDAEGNYKSNINTLLSLGYRRNLSNNITKNNWIGIDAGFMLGQKGSYFTGNTFMFGVNWEIGRYGMFGISVSPQLYITNTFKEAFPALKIGIGF